MNGWSQLGALDRSQTGMFAPGCQMTMQEVHGSLNDSAHRTRFNHVNQQSRHTTQKNYLSPHSLEENFTLFQRRKVYLEFQCFWVI